MKKINNLHGNIIIKESKFIRIFINIQILNKFEKLEFL